MAHKALMASSITTVAVYIRVARWFVLKPKNPIRVNFGGP
jgi:hypothetical protein